MRLAAQARGARAVPRPAAPLRPAVGGAQLLAGPALAPRARGRASRRAPGERVLDVATGTGMVAAELLARCELHGRRHRPERRRCSAAARARFAARRARVELIEGEAEALPFADDELRRARPSPTCCATSTIRAATMRELARVVRPGRPRGLARVRRAAVRARARGVAPLHGGRAAGCSVASPRASGARSGASSARASAASTSAIRCERIVDYWQRGRARATCACAG